MSIERYDLLVNNLQEIDNIISEVDELTSSSVKIKSALENKSLNLTTKNKELHELNKKQLSATDSIEEIENDIVSMKDKLAKKKSDQLISRLLEHGEKYSYNQSKIEAINGMDFREIYYFLDKKSNQIKDQQEWYDVNCEGQRKRRIEGVETRTNLVAAFWTLLIVTVMVGGFFVLLDTIDPNGKSLTYECPDGTVVEYDEVGSGTSISDLEDDPPGHWCDEAIDWAIDKKETAIFSIICGPVIILVVGVILIGGVVARKLAISGDDSITPADRIKAKIETFGEDYETVIDSLDLEYSSVMMLKASCNKYVKILDNIANAENKILHYQTVVIPNAGDSSKRILNEIKLESITRDKLEHQHKQSLAEIKSRLGRIDNLYHEISDMIPSPEL